jgi:hypothetical protein
MSENENYLPFKNKIYFKYCTLASSTTKNGRHDIAEILLKVMLKHKKSKIKSYILLNQCICNRDVCESTRREPPTMGKQLVNFITCGCESSAPFFVIYKAGHEPTPYW